MATDPVTGRTSGTYVLPSREREIEVLAAIVEGNGRKGAAALLHLTEGTINSHVQRAFDAGAGATLYGLIFLGGRDDWLPVPRLEEIRLDPSVDRAAIARIRDRVEARLRRSG